MSVSLSTVKEYAEQVAKSHNEHDFKTSNGWWQKLVKTNSIGKSVRLHGEAGGVNPEESKGRIQDIEKNPRGAWDEMSLHFRLTPSATYTSFVCCLCLFVIGG